MVWLYSSALFMVITAAIHSLAGEKRLLSLVFSASPALAANTMAGRIFRGAWHLTSLFMALTAAVMVWPDTSASLKALVAGTWLAVGLYSLISSRGKHIGWPSLALAGVTGLIGSVA